MSAEETADKFKIILSAELSEETRVQITDSPLGGLLLMHDAGIQWLPAESPRLVYASFEWAIEAAKAWPSCQKLGAFLVFRTYAPYGSWSVNADFYDFSTFDRALVYQEADPTYKVGDPQALYVLHNGIWQRETDERMERFRYQPPEVKP